MPIGSIDINSNSNLVLSIGAAITGVVFGELTLRSWRELAEVILSRGATRRDPPSQLEINQKGVPIATDKGRAIPVSTGAPRGIMRFLILKGVTIAVPVLFFVAARPTVGYRHLLIFIAVYIVYLFFRGWRLQRKVV